MSILYEQALADVNKLKEVAEAEASKKLLKGITEQVKRLVEEEIMQLDDFGGASSTMEPLEVDPQSDDDDDNTSAAPGIPVNPPLKMPGQNNTPVAPVDLAAQQPIAMTADLAVTEIQPTVDAPSTCSDDQESCEDVVPDATAEHEIAAQTTAGEDVDMSASELDQEEHDDDDTFELDFDATRMIESIKKSKLQKKNLMSEKQVAKKITLIETSIKSIDQNKLLRNKTSKNVQSLIESVENTYNYVQEFLPGSTHRAVFEEKLEKQYKMLNDLLEKRENKMKRQPVNEEDLTVKLTGLPEMDDDQLEELGVDLVAGDADEDVEMSGDDDDLDFDMSSDDEDMGDGDMDADDSMDDDLDVDENAVIEIDENALVAEIKKMRAIREEKAGLEKKKAKQGDWGQKPSHAKKAADEKGEKASASEADDFGGGKFAAKVKLNKSDKGERVAEGKASYNSKLQIALAEQRKQLAETNLLNAKLVYTNKLLQNETISARQKAAIVDRLEEATTISEAKLIYESLTKALARTATASSQRVMGSSSSVTSKSGISEAAQVNEGFDTGRWARLAGLKGVLKG